MSDFLKNLKKAVDDGEFNSKVANKINEINKKADEYLGANVEENINKRIKETGGPRKISSDKLPEINSEYEKQMLLVEKQNQVSNQLIKIIDLDKQIEEQINMFDKLIDETLKIENLREINSEIEVVINKIKNKYKFKVENEDGKLL